MAGLSVEQTNRGFALDKVDIERARREGQARLFGEQPQRILFSRYEVLERIGAGAWGTVYRARDPVTERAVALKVLHEHVMQRERSLWQREATLLAAAEHPNVIRVFDVGTDHGRAFIVTELVPRSRTLVRWFERERPWPRELARGAAELAEALAVVHRRGILHRDLKPENILIHPDGRFLLSDFGLAAPPRGPESEAATDATIVGTPFFMAPEVRAGRGASEASDVYGLCAAIWYVLADRTPLQGSVPRPLKRPLRAGLDRDPMRRPSARELAHFLHKGSVPVSVSVSVAAVALAATSLAVVAGHSLPMGVRQSGVGPAAATAIRPKVSAALEDISAARDVGDTVQASDIAQMWIRRVGGSRWRADFEQALGRVRLEALDTERAVHLFEAAYFDAAGSGRAELAALAALGRVEAALDLDDVRAGDEWTRKAGLWFQRSGLSDANLDARRALADSRLKLAKGELEDALDGLPPVDGLMPVVAYAIATQRSQVAAAGGEVLRSLSLAETAAAMVQTSLPESHPRRRDALHNVAVAAFMAGNAERAAEGFEETLRWYAAWSPTEAQAIAEVAMNAGAAYWQLGDLETAARLTSLALERLSQRPGEDSRTIDCLANLAAIEWTRGNASNGISFANRALLSAESHFGSESPRILEPLVNLSVMLLSDGEKTRAARLLKRALAIASESGAPEMDLAYIQANRCRLLRSLGEVDLAIRAGERALSIYGRLLPPSHPERVAALVSLSFAVLESGDLDAAAQYALEVWNLEDAAPSRRARSAFALAQVDALRDVPVDPGQWIVRAQAELERARSRGPSDDALESTLRRWRDDWRSESRTRGHRSG